MENKRIDISLIQKYLNGELDATAMHRLERQAQDDPFLMDALEGYASAKNDQQENLNALQHRLQQRTAAKVRRITPWTVTAIAASVIGFAVVVGILYKGDDTVYVQAPKIAISPPVKAATTDTVATPNNKNTAFVMPEPRQQIASAKPLPIREKASISANSTDASAPVTLSDPAVAQEDVFKSIPDSSAMEDKVMEYMAAKKQDTVVGGGYVAINKDKASALSALRSKAEGVSITEQPGKRFSNNAYALTQANLPPGLVSGVVLSRIDGAPLPGVSVKVVGKPIATQTDVSGKFTLPNVKKDEKLAFGYFGYNTKTLNLKGADSVKVVMDESSAALSEVVVANSAKKKAVKNARPEAGWDNLKKYLYDSAIAPDGKEGTVELKFMVNANGSITDIKVNKSLSEAADKKAISLINDGPTWTGNASGRPEQLTVKVKFHK